MTTTTKRVRADELVPGNLYRFTSEHWWHLVVALEGIANGFVYLLDKPIVPSQRAVRWDKNWFHDPQPQPVQLRPIDVVEVLVP